MNAIARKAALPFAVLASAMGVAACGDHKSHEHHKTSLRTANNSPKSNIRPDATPQGTYRLRRPEAQEALNKFVNTVVDSKLQDLPEEIEAFRHDHAMSFRHYRTKSYKAPNGKPYERIASYSKKGTGRTSYGFYVSYIERSDGKKGFDVISMDEQTTGKPTLAGPKEYEDYELSRRSNGDWAIDYTHIINSTSERGTEYSHADPHIDLQKLKDEIAYFDHVLDNN